VVGTVRGVTPQRIIGASRDAAVVLGLVFAAWAGWGSPAPWALPLLALAIVVTEATSVRIFVGGQAAGFTLNDAVIAAAFVLAPGSWIAVGAITGYVLAKFRRAMWLKLSFNAAQQLLAVSAGVLVTELAGGGIPGAIAGLATFAVLNSLAVGIPIAATSGVPYGRVLMTTIGPLGIVHNAGNASVGLLAGWLVLNAPLGLLGLIVPVGMLWWSYQQQTRRAAEARLFAELAQGQEKAAGSTVDASAQVVVTAAARLLGGADVELLLRHPDGPIRYVGDEHGLSARLRAEADAFDASWVLRALGERGVRTGVEGDRPYCSAVLGDPSRPLAVLVARRAPRAAGFTRADVQLAEVLVSQAETWLSVADLTARHDVAIGRAEAYGAASRVLGGLGEQTVPALAVLRESANRLSRLASSFDGPDPVKEIVAELHAVERAVASLLGAIVLASDPSPADGTDPAGDGTRAGARGETEWTTTGRLEDAVRP
jgi:hypothetical protein